MLKIKMIFRVSSSPRVKENENERRRSVGEQVKEIVLNSRMAL